RSGADGQNLPAHGGGIRGRNRVPGAGRLRSQLAPGYALPKLAPQPTRTRTNNPEEWESTEHLGLDSACQRVGLKRRILSKDALVALHIIPFPRRTLGIGPRAGNGRKLRYPPPRGPGRFCFAFPECRMPRPLNRF